MLAPRELVAQAIRSVPLCLDVVLEVVRRIVAL